jgi:pimeloyl-ACP methyl ester carboxylesterase
MIVPFAGRQIHYWEYGQGPPLVLLHGFLESSSMWKRLVPEWSRRFRVITIDLPGHGKSHIIGHVHKMTDIAAVVEALLDKLNIENAHIMGHSMGGYVSLAFGEKYPDRLSSLCLLNSTCLPDSVERLKNRTRALKLLDNDHKAFIRLTIPALFSAKNRKKFAPNIKEMQDEAYLFPLEGIKANIRGMMHRPDRTHVLGQLAVPRLLVSGKDDPIIDEATIKKIALQTGSGFISIPGGHMSQIENWSEIVKIVHFIE